MIVANGTSARSRGVVMTASYEARAFGVHSALSLSEAYRRCPDAILVPSDIAFYRRASRAVMELLGGFTDTVEVAGLDEAYLDLSGSPTPRTRARELKKRVRDATGLTCSIGLGDNKLLAKIASDLEKPDGLTLLPASEMPERVEDASIRIIPGCGPKTEERLSSIGISTVGQLASSDEEELARLLGERQAASIRAKAHGEDDRILEAKRTPKSESRETTFSEDVADFDWLADKVDELAAEVCQSLRKGRRRGKTVVLKAKLASFKTLTRSRTIPEPTRDPDTVSGIGRELLAALDAPEPLRLVGIGLSGLVSDDSGQSEGRLFSLDSDAA